MITKTFIIKNEQGLHMRPASIMTKAMNAYKCDVTIVKNGLEINGKSIMLVMSACIKYGTEIEVRCNGEDEELAMSKITELIESGFGEM